MYHRVFALSSGLLLAIVVAGSALAGGWAEVTVTDLPGDPVAGSPTTVGLQVMQHGRTAVSWPKLTVIATDRASGATVRSEAKAQGATGRYVAIVILPTAGVWNLSFESPDLVMSGSSTVEVGPALPGTAAAFPGARADGAGGGAAVAEAAAAVADPTASVGPASEPDGRIPLAIGLVIACLAVAGAGPVLARLRDRDGTAVPG